MENTPYLYDTRVQEQNPRSLRRITHRRKLPYLHFCAPRLRVFSPQIFQELLLSHRSAPRLAFSPPSAARGGGWPAPAP